MKGLKISYKIHEFSRKSDKYWGSCACFSENTEKHWKTLKHWNTETLKKHWKTLKNTEKHWKTLKKYYFLIFVWNFQKSYFHAKIIFSRQKKYFPAKTHFSRQKSKIVNFAIFQDTVYVLFDNNMYLVEYMEGSSL